MKLKFGQPVPKGRNRTNPMIQYYGNGPDGKRCRDCLHFLVIRRARDYPKCSKREVSRSQRTDHAKTFKACGLFVQRNGEEMEVIT